MKVTVIKNKEIEHGIICSENKVYESEDIKKLVDCAIGERAIKIHIDGEFNKDDIPYLIKFLHNCEPCFPSK